MKCTPLGPESELEMHCLLRVSAKASGPQRKTPILVLLGKKEKRQFQALGWARLQSTWGDFLLISGLRAESPLLLCPSANDRVQVTMRESGSALFAGLGRAGSWLLQKAADFSEKMTCKQGLRKLLLQGKWGWICEPVGYCPSGLYVPKHSSILKSRTNPLQEHHLCQQLRVTSSLNILDFKALLL